ncbi:MAG: hypothetical protein E7470_00895 [Ruminococcaceae bacterium]|nr:hypothetical protein [Oscillospiraceae bacterium]
MILDRVKTGIDKYNWIMTHVHEVDVSADAAFQKFFNGFYRMRQRPAAFYSAFYAYLERNKSNKALCFEDIIMYLYQKTGSIHASFSSKLLATVNPDMPIWDKFVLKNLGLRTPYHYESDRLQKTVQLYQKICDWYQSEEAAEKLKEFNKLFPNVDISDVKKIDFILWATR